MVTYALIGLMATSHFCLTNLSAAQRPDSTTEQSLEHDSDSARQAIQVADALSFSVVPGPNLVTSELSDLQQFGREGEPGEGIVGLASLIRGCNVGTVPLHWFAFPSIDHPVMGTNMYRVKPVSGALRFEQIGHSWIKHGFGAGQEAGFCGVGVPCTPFPNQTELGVGCSDPYVAGQLANACLLAPRSVVNPFTGAMPAGGDLGSGGGCGTNYPAMNHIGHIHDNISHRLQVRDVDLAPGGNVDADYFYEGFYYSPHEFAAANGNQYDNVSHCKITIGGSHETGQLQFNFVSPLQVSSPALDSWDGAQQSLIEPAPLVDGRAFLAYQATDMGDGLWHYEYVLYNMNLDRALDSLLIPVPVGVSISGVGFHAPLHHAPELHAENYSNSPWTSSLVGGAHTWSTTPFATDPLANAVRWGMAYTFWFDANTAPQSVTATVGLFKTAGTTTTASIGPAPLAFVDCNNNSLDDRCDVSCANPGCSLPGCGQSSDCTGNGIPDECEADCDDNGEADRCELAAQTATDCNENNLMDRCEPGGMADCNSNDRADFCDLLLEESTDGNSNNIPDECESGNRTYFVDDDTCPLPGIGTTYLPFCNLGSAFAIALSGDTIVVRDGQYAGPGNTGLDFAGRSLILRSENGPDNCFIGDLVTPLDIIVIPSGNSQIIGLTFRRRNVNLEGAVALFRECRFEAGTQVSANNGTILAIEDSQSVGSRFRVTNESELIVNRSKLLDSFGAAITCSRSILVVRHSQVLRGGSIQFPLIHTYAGFDQTFCEMQLYDSWIGGAAQDCVHFGGVFDGVPPATLLVENCTIADCGRRAIVVSGEACIVRNSILWSNLQGAFEIFVGHTQPMVEFSNVEGGWSGTGNIDVDPLFVDAPNGDYHLSPASPCRDVGEPTFSGLSVSDFDGEPRVVGARVDMGADEYRDCNGSGLPDYQDVAASTSADCDGNAIPDECEITILDCNGNSIWDPCDISSGSSADCQQNGVPDSCDVAPSGGSIDCDLNGIPDECEPDCNNNHQVDACDVALGASLDCNSNMIPDDCEVAASLVPDCNANVRPDSCDIADGPSTDDNTNNVPDECELLAPVPSPNNREKNRYITFMPFSTSAPRAYRVDKTTAPTGTCWATAPDAQGNARCGSSPVFRVWSEQVIHVGDCAISPVAAFEVRATPDGTLFSPPYVVNTISLPALNAKHWGDLVGTNNGLEWTPPNQFTNVNDILAILAYITSAPIKPTFQQANLQAISSTDPCLNAFVNTADVLIAVKAVAGDPYPFTTNPAQCPVCP